MMAKEEKLKRPERRKEGYRELTIHRKRGNIEGTRSHRHQWGERSNML